MYIKKFTCTCGATPCNLRLGNVPIRAGKLGTAIIFREGHKKVAVPSLWGRKTKLPQLDKFRNFLCTEEAGILSNQLEELALIH
jgi:hypothetical protein